MVGRIVRAGALEEGFAVARRGVVVGMVVAVADRMVVGRVRGARVPVG